jgi:ribA/ribD-fused uncharacterized protein
MTINRFRGQWAFLSSFYPSGFKAGNLWYPTVEHFFQAMKSTNMEYRVMVAACPTASQAKYMGSKKGMRQNGFTLRENWESIKEDVMLFGLREKFSDPTLRHMLLSTGDEPLEEGNGHGDTYWGTVNGEGKNRLGKLLEQVREEIK